jgi:hypothetical protein
MEGIPLGENAQFPEQANAASRWRGSLQWRSMFLRALRVLTLIDRLALPLWTLIAAHTPAIVGMQCGRSCERTDHHRRTNLLARVTRWTHGVLALWCVVLLLSALAPLAQARSTERLCSGAAIPQWTPLHEDASEHGATANAHVLECPLCLPLIAAPPTAQTFDRKTTWAEHYRPMASPLRLAAAPCAWCEARAPPSPV